MASDSSSTVQKQVATFVFLDVETTGLRYPRITELAMWVTPRNDLTGTAKNRSMLYKCTMPLNPGIPIEEQAAAITGLDNDILNKYKEFEHDTGLMILSYLDHFPKPICLVSHNGKRFDFPILKKSYDYVKLAFPSDIYCTDTLDIFKKLQSPSNNANNRKRSMSFKLSEIYGRVFEKPPVVMHQAEADVEIMYKLAKFYGEQFVNIAEECAMPFTEKKSESNPNKKKKIV